MTKEHPNPANSRSSNSERDFGAKAVLDNMARLKALRLAREAAEPPRPVATKKTRANPKDKSKDSPRKTAEKAPALSEWLASQQGGGRRT
jgi:hypothetical protein